MNAPVLRIAGAEEEPAERIVLGSRRPLRRPRRRSCRRSCSARRRPRERVRGDLRKIRQRDRALGRQRRRRKRGGRGRRRGVHDGGCIQAPADDHSENDADSDDAEQRRDSSILRLMNGDLRTRVRRSNGATGDASAVGRQEVGEHAPERADVDRFFENMVDAQVPCLLPHAIVEKGRDEDASRAELPPPQLGKQGEAVHLRHLVIDEEQIDAFEIPSSDQAPSGDRSRSPSCSPPRLRSFR